MLKKSCKNWQFPTILSIIYFSYDIISSSSNKRDWLNLTDTNSKSDQSSECLVQEMIKQIGNTDPLQREQIKGLYSLVKVHWFVNPNRSAYKKSNFSNPLKLPIPPSQGQSTSDQQDGKNPKPPDEVLSSYYTYRWVKSALWAYFSSRRIVNSQISLRSEWYSPLDWRNRLLFSEDHFNPTANITPIRIKTVPVTIQASRF